MRTANGAIHFVLTAEKVCPDYLAPIEHLVKMKLTSYRLKDMTHISISPEMEAELAPALRKRLAYITARE